MGFEGQELKEEKREFLFLSERDQQNLEESGRNILIQLLKDFPKELPDAIILPDSSARPLVYMFLPAFRRVAKDRSVDVPRFYFFQGDVGLDIIDVARRTGVSDQIQERAQEIKRVIKKENPKIVIIDDYASKRMRTIRDIRDAFGELIPAYVLLGEDKPDILEKEDIKFGIENPYTEKFEWGTGSYGFEFRRKRFKEKVNTSGVVKEEGAPYPAPIRDGENLKASNDLRRDMKKIGEMLASRITE